MVYIYIDQLEHHLQSHDQDAPQLLDIKVSILLYADDIVLLFQSPSGLQKRLNVLQLFCAEKLLLAHMSKTQVVIFSDLRHSHSDSFLHSHQQLQIVEQYTYLGIALHKGGFDKHAINKLTSAGKRALFAMLYRCSDLALMISSYVALCFLLLFDRCFHMAAKFGGHSIQTLGARCRQFITCS